MTITLAIGVQRMAKRNALFVIFPPSKHLGQWRSSVQIKPVR